MECKTDRQTCTEVMQKCKPIKAEAGISHNAGSGNCSQRWILAYMGLWLGMMGYMFNCDMSIAVVCMVKDDTEKGGRNTSIFGDNETENTPIFSPNETGYQNLNESKHSWANSAGSGASCAAIVSRKTLLLKGAEFNWSKKSQSLILSAYFYGYMMVQIPGGWLATRFGGKRVISACMALSSVIMLLMPVFARASVYVIIIARICQGICVGCTMPAFCGMIGRWALPTERNRFMSLCWFGQMVGAVVGYSTSGILCAHGFDNGWPSIFYVHGMIGFLFVCCWWCLVYTSPETHPRISERERSLLTTQHGGLSEGYKQKVKVPWKSIMTYFPVYVMFTAHIADTWTFFLILTSLPLYLKEVHKFDIQSNGFLSCLPFVSLMVGIAASGWIADYIRTKNWLTVTRTRKIFQVTGLVGVAAFILIPGYLSGDNRNIVIVCLCFCTLFESIGMVAGYSCNAVDMAPRFASVIFGISNTLACIPGIVAPLVVAVLTKNQTTEEWRVVFYIAVGVSIFAAVFYGLFANSELAPWAETFNFDQEIKIHDKKHNDDQTELPLLILNSNSLTVQNL